jgi:diguanylate cyclase (GGDEF)-like protein
LNPKDKDGNASLDGSSASKLLDRVTDYVIVLDGSLKIAFANRAFRTAVLKNGGTSFRDTLEEPCLAVLDGGLSAGAKSKSGSEDYHLSVTHRLHDGGTQQVHYKLFPLDEDQGMLGAVGRVLLFSEGEEAKPARRERRAKAKPLSQEPPVGDRKTFNEVMPRKVFFEEAEKEVRAASRYRYPVSCLAIDIDNFSNVNESHGNGAGDFVIGRMAQILQGQVRQSDYVAKFGSDEFVILAPHTDRVNARFLAERLRRRVQDTDFEHEETHVSVTVSIGVATLMQATGIAGEELIKRAVTALREAQQRGKNRVVVYS